MPEKWENDLLQQAKGVERSEGTCPDCRQPIGIAGVCYACRVQSLALPPSANPTEPEINAAKRETFRLEAHRQAAWDAWYKWLATKEAGIPAKSEQCVEFFADAIAEAAKDRDEQVREENVRLRQALEELLHDAQYMSWGSVQTAHEVLSSLPSIPPVTSKELWSEIQEAKERGRKKGIEQAALFLDSKAEVFEEKYKDRLPANLKSNWRLISEQVRDLLQTDDTREEGNTDG